MKITTSTLKALTGTLLTLLLFSSTGYTQGRVDYRQLAGRSAQSNIYFDFFSLPGSSDSTLTYVSTFRMDYSFLPFRKTDRNNEEKNFYSSSRLNWEIFKAEKKRENNNFSVEGLQSAGRANWSDTVYAETYEQTQSNTVFADGYMTVELKPGLYNYLLQLIRGEEVREQNSRSRQVELKRYDEQSYGDLIPVESITGEDGMKQLRLMNFGDNVHYGKDFFAFVHLPRYEEGAEYSLEVSRVETSQRDTTQKAVVFQKQLAGSEFHTGLRPVMSELDGSPVLNLIDDTNGYAYALVKIPNSTFANAVYRLTVTKKGEQRPSAQGIFRSLWLDMPTSLLNLNVAIEMTKYIVDKETLQNLKTGSSDERERKFRAFWKSKDPTPKTEFNELMAEYYRRVDYAYANFSSVNMPGYESDQGRIYIQYGPPNNIERKFPSGEPAVEIWTYDNRQFVFEATTGFGDFKLIR